MNATTLAELRQVTGGGGLADQKMDQVRELLFGEHRRATEQRLSALEARTAEFERDVRDRIGAIDARISALAASSEGDRRAQFEELSRAVGELGSRIGAIAKP